MKKYLIFLFAFLIVFSGSVGVYFNYNDVIDRVNNYRTKKIALEALGKLMGAQRPDGRRSLYFASDYTGGTAYIDIDALLINATSSSPNRYDLMDGDLLLFGEISDGFQVYVFDSDGTSAEDVPLVIRPNDFSTEGIWRRVFPGFMVTDVDSFTEITSPKDRQIVLIYDGATACSESQGNGEEAYFLIYSEAHTDWHCIGGGGGSSSETDPVVGAVGPGIVKSDGNGNISVAVADVDFQDVLDGWQGSAAVGSGAILDFTLGTLLAAEKLHNFTPGVTDSWSGPTAIVKAGENLSQWDVVYLEYNTDGPRAYAYNANSTDTKNDTYPPCGVVVDSDTITAGVSFYMGIGVGVARHDPGDASLDWGLTHGQDEGKPIYCSESSDGGLELAKPNDSGDHIIRIGTVVEVDNGDNGDVILFNFGFADVVKP